MEEVATAVFVSVFVTVAIGLLLRSVMELRSAVNWFVQVAILVTISTVANFSVMQICILLAIPTALHIVRWAINRWVMWRIESGAYGDEAKWAYELLQNDTEFLEAHKSLSAEDVREVQIISESRAELRENVIERADEKN